MLRYTSLALSLLLLAGCAAGTMTLYEAYKAGKPFPMYYKTGADFAQISNDNTNCQIEAAQRVPARTEFTQTPTYTSSAQTICNSYGTGYGVTSSSQTFCTQFGGDTYGGDIQSYDANTELRHEAAHQCMGKKGYRYVGIPPCPSGVDISGQDNERVLRPLAATTCYQIPSESSGLHIGNY